MKSLPPPPPRFPTKPKTALITAILISILALAGCDNGGGDPQTATYTGTVNGTAYTLKITETARYTAQGGDTYELTGGSKKSTGTVNAVSGSVITLKPSKGTGAITVTISGSSIASISITGTVSWDDDSPFTAPGTLTPGGNSASVYVAGYYVSYNDSYNYKACYWVNGTRTDLPIPNGTQGQTFGIAVQGGNVYVSGVYHSNYNNYKACYWVNGTRTDLPVPNGTEGYSHGIAVQGGNVYVAGYYYDSNYNYTACYWVNGTRTDLSGPNGTQGQANGVAVQGGNVYVSGAYGYYDDEEDISYTACYWVDGTRTDLPIPNGTQGLAFGIAVQGGNVYVSGVYVSGDDSYNYKACYWVDGARTDLPVPNGSSISLSSGGLGIAVQGGNVYVSGGYYYYFDDEEYISEEDILGAACYWVDGTRTDLPIPNGSSGGAGIAVQGGNVYVSGYYHNDACYWVNGTRVDLPLPPSGVSSSAASIAVVTQ